MPVCRSKKEEADPFSCHFSLEATMNTSTTSEGNAPSTSESSSHLLHHVEDESKVENEEEPSLSFLSAVELQVFKNFVKNYSEKRECKFINSNYYQQSIRT